MAELPLSPISSTSPTPRCSFCRQGLLGTLRGLRQAVNSSGELWWTVPESTGQPLRIGDPTGIPHSPA